MVSALCCGAITACREPAGVAGFVPHRHMIATLALATDGATGLRLTCRYGTTLMMDSIPGAAWTRSSAGDDSRVSRQLFDSTLTAVFSAERNLGVIQFSATYPGPDSIEIVVSGPIADTLRGHVAFGAWGGAWRCPASIPLANDSALVARGYNASLPMLGTWSLSPESPID
jgi:hypothetical protein